MWSLGGASEVQSTARSIDAGNIPSLLGWDSAMVKFLRLEFPITTVGT